MTTLKAISTGGAALELLRAAIDELRPRIRGRMLLPAENGYDESRSIWNAMIDRRPALIVQALGTADVVAAVQFARKHDLALSIKGGGHNIAGLAVCDGGLMLDMALMRATWVDHANRTAHAQAGCLLGDVDRETQLHGLAAVLGFVSATGTAGLTLGGGFGYLTRRFGWTSDNVRSMTVVTADGRLLNASEDENPDLFWGLRGGGGNFGVVTDIEYALYDIGPEIVGGAMAWRAERAPEVLAKFRTLMNDAPPEVTCVVSLRKAPPAPWIDKAAHGQSVVIVLVCHTGPVAQAERWVAQLKALGSPVGDVVQRRPYVSLQSMLDATQPKGRRYYWKSEYLSGHDPALLEKASAHAARVASPHSAVVLFPLDGPLNRLPEGHSSVGNRSARSVINITASWEAPADDAANIEWARATWRDIRPFSTGGTYVNFLTDDETDDRVRSAYGGNYTRLAELKRRWDPDNFFRRNKNVAP
jgi:FAD/FMN-containing dehydrogenase